MKSAGTAVELVDSKVREEDWPWRSEIPYGRIRVGAPDGPFHEIHWQQFGAAAGLPVIVIHGGPGAGCALEYAQVFDPAVYRIILFDQRGSGNSTPAVHADREGGLAANTTQHLIADIDAVLDVLHVSGKVHVFGGSWGSTLALVYAIARPERVSSLQLRGIFLGHRAGLDYFYQGNAADYDDQQPSLAQRFDADPGAYRAYLGDGTLPGQIPAKVYERLFGLEAGPAGYRAMREAYAAAWDRFVRVIPRAEREDMVAAYSRIYEQRPTEEAGRQRQLEAALAWTRWEGLTSYLLHKDPADLGQFDDPKFALTFALIECRYFMNGCYLGGKSGEGNRDSNFIMENIGRIKAIPTYIVHGKYDQVAPFADAQELYDGLKALRAQVELQPTDAGHSLLERENALALMENAKRAARL